MVEEAAAAAAGVQQRQLVGCIVRCQQLGKVLRPPCRLLQIFMRYLRGNGYAAATGAHRAFTASILCM
jgi:hypothetical protein